MLGILFREKGLRPILVGGWALNALGIIRQTFDFDIMIEESSFDDVRRGIESLGYEIIFRNELFAKFRHAGDEWQDIDCLFTDRDTYAKISADGTDAAIGGACFILPAPVNIIAMKLHSLRHGAKERRRKDFDDLLNLLKREEIDLSDEAFGEFCLKYGTEEILRELRDEIKD